jgi:hypothetical protein
MVCGMASEDSDWSVSFPPPNWNVIRTTDVVTSDCRFLIPESSFVDPNNFDFYFDSNPQNLFRIQIKIISAVHTVYFGS